MASRARRGAGRTPASRRAILAVAVVVVGVIALGLAAIERSGLARRQGLLFFGLPDVRFWLSGRLVTPPVTDWSFTDAFPTARIQTRTWYLLPYSVTIFFARHEGQLYLFSDYAAPAPGQPDLRDRFPEARAWNRNLVRDPRCRLQIGDQVFDCRAYVLSEAKEMEVAREAFFVKYPQLRDAQRQPEARRDKMHFFRVEVVGSKVEGGK